MRVMPRLIREYNHVVPHSSLNGGTPMEVFNGTWGISEQKKLARLHEQAVTNRFMRNRTQACEGCYLGY